MALLLFTRPTGWGFGLGMLSLCLAGLAADVFITLPGGDFSGYIRLGQLAAFPLLTILLTRAAGETTSRVLSPTWKETPTTPLAYPRRQERRRYSTDPRTLHAWLEVTSATEPEKIISGIAKAVSQTMLSDLCFIVSGPEFGHIVLRGGYDLVREEQMDGTMLEQSQLPTLLNALQRGKTVRITEADPQPADLKTLSSAFGIKEAGSMMFIPLILDEKPQGGILFLSPYSNRQWSQDDQGFLTSEIEVLARMLLLAQKGKERETPETIGAKLSAEMESLRLENQGLLIEVAALRQDAQNSQQNYAVDAPELDLSSLVALQQESQEQISTLQAENERMRSVLKEQGITAFSSQDFNHVEDDLRTTLREIAQLQNKLADTNARNLMLEREVRQTSNNGSYNHQEVVTSIVQEIRQPMASIVGYTDLLLAETVGILGALQRKFLERVKASSERMRSMLDDLVQVTTEGDGSIEFPIKPVEIGLIIDSAVAETSAQLREKNIALRVDLPEDLPKISVDRNSIQQIVLHLLQNAGGATPQDGTITLRARMQEDHGENYLMLLVTDTGGGIAPEDLPRVFTRRYRADLPLIQGLGDTGIGLSIAKTLVEAHGGRIWVDCVADQSTTISVLAPIHLDSDLNAQE